MGLLNSLIYQKRQKFECNDSILPIILDVDFSCFHNGVVIKIENGKRKTWRAYKWEDLKRKDCEKLISLVSILNYENPV